MKRLLGAFVSLCLIANVHAQTKSMDAPGYTLGSGTTFDASQGGAFVLPSNGLLPSSCKAGQIQLVGSSLEFCSSVNTWVTFALTGQSGMLSSSVIPSLNQLNGTLQATQLPGVIISNTTGNAGTATALAVTPAACAPGLFATGISAMGAASCSHVQIAQVQGAAPSSFIDTTNANNIVSGTVNVGRLPSGVLLASQINNYLNQTAPVSNPPSGQLFIWSDTVDRILKSRDENGVLGVAVHPQTASSHQYATGLSASGMLLFAQPTASDILGLSNSAVIDATNASLISSGVLPAARLPLPTANTPGGVSALAYTAHQWLDSIATSGIPHASQPQILDIGGIAPSSYIDTTNAVNIASGVLNPLRLPPAGSNALGAVQAFPAQPHVWLNGLSTSGIFAGSQPTLSDIAGSFAGDLTGSLAGPVVARVNGTSVPVNTVQNQVLVTIAPATSVWLNIPPCLDSAGQHLNYDANAHALICGTSAPGAGSVSFSALGAGTNSGALLIGGSLAPTGSGTITANSYAGIVPRANLPAAISYSDGATIRTQITPPSTPLAGTTAFWADAIDFNLKAKDQNGQTTVTVRPTPATVHQFVSSIASNGAVTTAQPQISDIAGAAPSSYIDTTNANNLQSGTVPPARIPLPTGTTIGGVQALAPSAHLWMDGISTAGVPHVSQPQIGDIGGTAPSSYIDATNANNIGSGTINAARLPASVLLSSQLNTLNVLATPSSNPAVGTVSVWADSTTKNLKSMNELGTVTTMVQPLALLPHRFVTGLSGNGGLTTSQISVTDIQGLSNSGSVDTTNASNIVSGQLSANLLPSTISSNTTGQANTALALAGTPKTCSGSQLSTGISPNGNAICVTPPSIGSGSGGTGSLTIDASQIATGTILAARLPAGTVTSVFNDPNITGSITNNTLQLGWTGTLPASRLNSNVVQGVNNDSNITGSIANQSLTLSFLGQLPISRGGTGQSSKQSGFDALSPTSSLGDMIYSDGSHNQRLAGNSTNVQKFLCQTGTGTSSAAPAWCQITAGSIGGLSNSAFVDATNANNIVSGVLGSAQLPLPTLTNPGAVKAVTGQAHKFVSSIDTNGNPLLTQPQIGDIGGAAPSSYIDTTNANNLTTGTLNAARLPATINSNTSGQAATALSLAAVPHSCAAGLYAVGTDASANAICAGVQYGQISGTPFIPTNNNQIANGAGYITGAQVGANLPVTVVQNNQINTYWDQFEPTTPANGFTQVWTDKVNMVLEAKNSLGYRTITVAPSQAPYNQYVTGLLQNGTLTYSQIQAYQIAGLARSGTVDSTNANNITTGTLPANVFPINIPSNTTGNAATATAFSANPSICLGDQVSAGILANGNAVCKNVVSNGSGGSTTLPVATTVSAGAVIPSTGLSIDQSGNLTVAYGTRTATALQGNMLGAANGVAPLDQNALVPQANMPYANKVQLVAQALPACNASNAGIMSRVPGSTAAAPDQIAICINGGNSSYSWFFLGSGGSTGTGSNNPNPQHSFVNASLVSWTDNLQSNVLMPFVFNTSGSPLEYNSFTLSDANNVSLTFSQPASGISYLLAPAYTQSFSNATSVSVNHNLNSYNLVPIVLDTTQSVVSPSSFTWTLGSLNTATLTFSTPQSGTLLLAPVTGAYSQTFTNSTSVAVAHGLNSTNVAIAVYDASGNLSGYNTWAPTDPNDGVLTFSSPMSGSVVVIVP